MNCEIAATMHDIGRMDFHALNAIIMPLAAMGLTHLLHKKRGWSGQCCSMQVARESHLPWRH